MSCKYRTKPLDMLIKQAHIYFRPVDALLAAMPVCCRTLHRCAAQTSSMQAARLCCVLVKQGPNKAACVFVQVKMAKPQLQLDQQQQQGFGGGRGGFGGRGGGFGGPQGGRNAGLHSSANTRGCCLSISLCANLLPLKRQLLHTEQQASLSKFSLSNKVHYLQVHHE